ELGNLSRSSETQGSGQTHEEIKDVVIAEGQKEDAEIETRERYEQGGRNGRQHGAEPLVTSPPELGGNLRGCVDRKRPDEKADEARLGDDQEICVVRRQIV